MSCKNVIYELRHSTVSISGLLPFSAWVLLHPQINIANNPIVPNSIPHFFHKTILLKIYISFQFLLFLSLSLFPQGLFLFFLYPFGGL